MGHTVEIYLSGDEREDIRQALVDAATGRACERTDSEIMKPMRDADGGAQWVPVQHTHTEKYPAPNVQVGAALLSATAEDTDDSQLTDGERRKLLEDAIKALDRKAERQAKRKGKTAAKPLLT
jgi:hypothetical protein